MPYIIFAFMLIYLLVFLIWFGISTNGLDELEQELREREQNIKSLKN